MPVDSGMKAGIVSAILASSLTTFLFFQVDGRIRAERDRDRLDAIVATLVSEAGRTLDILESPVTASAISTLRPEYHFSQAALWAPEFQSVDISVETRIALRMFIERVQAAQVSIDYYRELTLSQNRSLTAEEVTRAQQSCNNARAAAQFFIDKLETYPRAARAKELLTFDVAKLGAELDSVLIAAGAKKGSQ